MSLEMHLGPRGSASGPNLLRLGAHLDAPLLNERELAALLSRRLSTVQLVDPLLRRHRARRLGRRCKTSSAPTREAAVRRGARILVLSDQLQREPLCPKARPEPGLTATTPTFRRYLRLEAVHQHLLRLGCVCQVPWLGRTPVPGAPPLCLPESASAPAPLPPGSTWETTRHWLDHPRPSR